MSLAPNTKIVTFRDGTSLVVSEATWIISMRMNALSEEAEKTPLDDVDQNLFHIMFYPRLLAAVVEGVAPTEQEALNMPDAELDKWFMAVKDLNPKWFAIPEKELPEGEAEKKSRNGKRRQRKS